MPFVRRCSAGAGVNFRSAGGGGGVVVSMESAIQTMMPQLSHRRFHTAHGAPAIDGGGLPERLNAVVN